jgi:RIO-like serine/threonine protein kinase
MTTLDFMVLRALARLSRMRKTVDGEALALRAGGSVGDVRGALRRLSRAELVTGGLDAPRLTMMGLALAVASSGIRPAAIVRGTLASRRRAA